MQHDFILLDCSGSMAPQWERALASVNAYVHGLAAEKVDTGVTLAVFDSDPAGKLAFHIVRDRIIPTTWRDVSLADGVYPRGGTPLSDATGRLVAMAESGKWSRAAIIIMTDGMENASREYTVEAARAALDRCRKRGWQVVFLGANFDNADQARAYNNDMRATVSVASANLVASGSMTAGKRAFYGATGQSIQYTDEEKEQLKK